MKRGIRSKTACRRGDDVFPGGSEGGGWLSWRTLQSVHVIVRLAKSMWREGDWLPKEGGDYGCSVANR